MREIVRMLTARIGRAARDDAVRDLRRSAGRSNCLLFALALRAKRRAKGKPCELHWRGTRMGLFGVHVLYVEHRMYDGRARMRHVSLKPVDPVYLLLPPVRFEGRVAWGDAPSPAPARRMPWAITRWRR